MKNTFCYLVCLLLTQVAAKAQMKIGDNPTTINGASLLELETTNKGLVFPRVLLTNVSSPAPLPAGLLTGTVLFNTNASITGGNGVGLYVWSGTVWTSVISTAGLPAWNLTGNTGTSHPSNFIGTTDNIGFRIRTNNIQRMMIDSLGDVAIGSTAFNPNNRERLLVDYGTTTSHTVANFKGSIDGYFQLNLQNTNSGINASTDFVATADDGTDSTFYVDMGINSSTYLPSVENWGNRHDAYLYSNSRNLLIGTQATPSDLIFLSGGGKIRDNAVMRITGPSGNVVIGRGESTDNPQGNIIRGPNGNGTNVAGGSLTLNGGAGTGTGGGGDLNLYGGITGSGGYDTVNIRANPLTITGIQTTTTFSTDSVLTIKAGVVKKAPYSSLPGGGGAWSTSGNSGTNASNFIGTTDGQGLTFKVNNIQAGYLGVAGTNDNTAFGAGSRALGTQSTAIGAGALANQNAALSIGYVATAAGQQSIAIGNLSNASIDGGIAIGSLARVTSQNGVAIGLGALAGTTSNTVAVGTGTKATAQNATAFGIAATASGNSSMVIGDSSTVLLTGVNSLIFGNNSSTTAPNTIIIGNGITTVQPNVLILGNTDKTVAISTTDPDPNAKLDVNGPFKLGKLGTVTKNSLSFSGSVNIQVPFGLGSHLDVMVSIPGRRLSSTQATVAVSPDNNLPNGIFIAFARVLNVNTIIMRFMNSETFDIPVNGNFYFTITEF